MIWLFSLGLIAIVGNIIVYSYLYGITPTPTSPKVKRHLISMLPAMTNIEIVELGSGWGNLAFALACHFPHCQITAYEISLIPYWISRVISSSASNPNLLIKRQDFFQISLSNASIIVCYLYPEAMQRLKIKFEKELAVGTYVISHTFAVPGWKPIRFEHVHDLYNTPIYLYQIGTGIWSNPQ